MLETETNPSAALAFLRNEERDETDLERKARFALMIAQIEQRSENYEAARSEYERILNEYANQTDAVNEASYNLPLTYLEEGNAQQGRAKLEDWVFADEDPAEEAPPLDTQWKRVGLARLAQAYHQSGDLSSAAALYERSGDFGTPQQRLKAKMQAWHTRLLQDDALEPLLEIGSLLPDPARLDSVLTGEIPVPSERLDLLKAAQHEHLRARLLYLQSQALVGVEREEQALQVLERLLTEHPESSYAEYARARLEN